MSKDRIIVALDVDSADKAVSLVDLLKNEVGAFKVGLELVNSAGLGVLDAITTAGARRVFYDCKLHDIPNTVAGAARAITKTGVWMFNVHCSGGYAMMKSASRAAFEAAEEMDLPPPNVIGVTLLTSIDQRILNDEVGVLGSLGDYVFHLAKLAKEAGLDGVVASPHEIEIIRRACGKKFLVVTPGVRPAGVEADDQKRVMTPKEALARGADYLVIGRPITNADDPLAAARTILGEI